MNQKKITYSTTHIDDIEVVDTVIWNDGKELIMEVFFPILLFLTNIKKIRLNEFLFKSKGLIIISFKKKTI